MADRTRRTRTFASLGALAWFSVASNRASVASDRASGQLPDEAAVRRALDDGRYGEAVGLAGHLVSSIDGEQHADSIQTARALNLQVEALLKGGGAAAPSTLSLAERALELTRRLAGEHDVDYAASLENLGTLRVERGEFRLALAAQEQALAIRSDALGRDHPAVADSLDDVALPLIRLDRFLEADERLKESQRIRETRPEQSLPLARTLYLVALLRRQGGDFAAAKTAADRAWDLQRQAQPTHPDTALTVQMRGDLLFFAGDWTGAQALWRESLATYEARLGPDHPLLARVLRWLANAAKSFGDLSEAQQLLDRALAIKQRSLAMCHPETAALLNDSANLATYGGRYSEAEKLYAEALAVNEQCLGPTHSLTATIIHNQGNLALEMGDLAKADALQSRAARVWSTGLGPDHPYVARALDARAEVATARGQFTRARTLYAQALSIREKRLGDTHPDTAWTLANLARTRGGAGELALSIQRADRATAIYRAGAASQEPDHFARALAISGSLEARRGEYERARERFAEALQVRERIFGASHPLTAEARADVGSAEFQLGDAAHALANALTAEQIGRDHLHYTIRYLPERQALEYAQRRPKGLDLALSIVAAGQAGVPAAIMDSVVQSRGVILDELAARARSATLADPSLRSVNAAASLARSKFATLMLRSVLGNDPVPRAVLDRTRQEKEAAERALAEQSVAEQADLQRVRAGADEVRRALPSGSALVSYVRYDRTFPSVGPVRAGAQQAQYIALVMLADSPDSFAVPLGSASSLEALVTQWRDHAVGRMRAPGASEDEAAYRAAGLLLRQRIWDPVAAHLDRAGHVFVVPDGALNLVSFPALPTRRSQYLVETGPVIQLLSTERDLVPGDVVSSGRGLLAVGGPSYGLGPAAPSTPSARRAGCGPAGVVTFADLPGARAEVREVSRIWASSPSDAAGTASPDDIIVLSGRAATEEAVLRTAGGRRVLHLATHGFFLDAGCEDGAAGTRGVGGVVPLSAAATVRDRNPLLVSGLALAGANLRGRPSSLNDDGVLTAEEVSSMNLQGTEWAVLSACDTGLGEIRSGEGVFGLRRAFQIAGVRTVIMSLWSVEDQAARVWMQALYQGRFRQHLSTADAVHQASLRVLQTRRARGESTHPFFWAGFVAAGDWR